MNYRELVEAITKSLVDKPSEVTVQELSGVMNTVIEIKTAKDDIGKVIGKRGRTIAAMRSILGAIGTKNGQYVRLQVLEH